MVFSRTFLCRRSATLPGVPTNLGLLVSRNVYILKRQHEVPSPKKGSKTRWPPHPQKHEHTIYDMVVNTNAIKKPNIDVLLTTFVEDLGKAGQIVSLYPTYAYTHFLLPGLAVYPTPENIKKIRLLSEAELDKYSSVTAYKTMKMLKKVTLSVFMNMNEPWTIEPWNIKVALRKQGIQITDDHCIQIPEKPISGPDLQLEGKDFVSTVVINNLERADVRCRLRHFTSRYSDQIVLSPDHDCTPAEAIFPDQEELLKSIPLPEYKAPEVVKKKKSTFKK